MANVHEIRLRGAVFSFSDYKHNRGSLLSILANAHREGNRATCLCSAHRPELYIVHRSGQYFLARMPNTGPSHESWCDFYDSPLDESGRGGYTEDAIVEDGEEFDVKLSIPLSRQRTASKEPSTRTERSSTAQTRRAAVGLMGLLHFLWEQSSNNRWFPYVKGKKASTRHWGGVHYFLTKTTAKIKRKAAPLQDSLYILPEFEMSKADSINAEFDAAMREVLASATEDAVQAGLPLKMKMIIGEVKSLTKSKFGYELKFRGKSTAFYMKDELQARMAKSYKPGMDAIDGSDGSRSIALAVVSASKKGYFNIDDLVLMATNRNYIPVDSSYEKTVADLLIAQERQFEKPLRYDNDELTLPDFVLLDCSESPRVPVEIYGMTGNAKYDARKREKRAIYRESGSTCWEWEPASLGNPPELPRKRSHNQVAK